MSGKIDFLNLQSLSFQAYVVYVLLLLLIFIVCYKLYVYNLNQFKQSNICESKLKTYKDVLSKCRSQYWYFGMSGEEIQKDINLIDYLTNAKNLSSVKILLLHPSSFAFRERLIQVHPNSQIDAIIERKTTQILSLLQTIKILPLDTKAKIEIRFTQLYPIWILQFIDSSTEYRGQIDKLYMKIHLPDKHSNKCPLYEVNSENNIFKSFKTYFDKTWDSALLTDSDYQIPDIYENHSRKKTIIMDFDGVLVDTNRLKKSILFKTISELEGYERKKDQIFKHYIENSGKSRLAYIKYAINCTGNESVSGLEERLLKTYKTLLDEELESVKPMDFVIPFCRHASTIAKVYIVSTAIREEIVTVTKKLGIYEYFTEIYDSEKYSKARAILDIKGKSNCAIDEMMFVGDSTEDILAAKETGVPLYLVRNDDLATHVSKAKVINNLFELAFYI